MADTDTTTVSALAWITMNPTVPFMVAGDLATMWRRIAAVTIVEQVEAVRMLIDPRLLPAQRRPFRRIAAVVVVAVVAVVVAVVAVVVAVAAVMVAVAANDVESCANRTRSR
jgi:hypothetical protein